MAKKSRRTELLLKLGHLAIKEAKANGGLNDAEIDELLENQWDVLGVALAWKFVKYAN